MNARIKRALANATSSLLLSLSASNGKWPDGSTILPFARGRDMACYARISHTYATTYISAIAETPRAAAEIAKEKKARKYASIT